MLLPLGASLDVVLVVDSSSHDAQVLKTSRLTRTADKFDETSNNYTQYVSINGQVVSELSTSSGEAQGWGSAVECAETTCGTVGAHKWTDTKIVLSSADPNYDQTLGKGQGVTGELSTSDGGVTWVATDINIPEFTFSG